jgi:predicted nucleic acid-binding protein
MSVLVDTGVLVAFLNERDSRHERAVELMRALMEGLHGTPFVSDYILDETYTFILTRTGRREYVERLWQLLRSNKSRGLLVLEFVGREDFWASRQLLEEHADRRLSFTDGTSVILVRRMGLDGIVSFDRDFDGLVERFH